MSELIEPFAAAIRKLLQGAVYYDDTKIWTQICDYETPIRMYVGRIGLRLELDKLGEFAYLHDLNYDDELGLPVLTRRIQLPLLETLLLVLFRERYDEFEIRSVDELGKLEFSLRDVENMLALFLPQQGDDRYTTDQIKFGLTRLKNEGFLKIKDERYEVRSIIRRKIDMDALQTIKDNLLRELGETEE